VRHPKKKFLPSAHYKAWASGVRHASKVYATSKKFRCEVSAFLADEHYLASTLGVRNASSMLTSTEKSKKIFLFVIRLAGIILTKGGE